MIELGPFVRDEEVILQSCQDSNLYDAQFFEGTADFAETFEGTIGCLVDYAFDVVMWYLGMSAPLSPHPS
jgi:hypothetical protein